MGLSDTPGISGEKIIHFSLPKILQEKLRVGEVIFVSK